MRFALILLLAWLMLGTTPAQAQACNVTISNINFGSIAPATTSAAMATGSVGVTCTGLVNLPMRICVHIGTGSGGTSYAPRLLSGGASAMQYNLFSDSAGTSIAGMRSSAYAPVSIDIPLTALTTYTTNVTLYGRVLAGQSSLVEGSYLSTFSGSAQAQVTYQAYLLSNPPSCTSLSANPTAVSFTVQASVINDCIISASNIDFGIAGLLTSTLTANGALRVACTNGAPYSITLSAGTGANATVVNRVMTRNGASDQVRYQLYQDPGFITPWGDGTSGTSSYAGVGTGSAQNVPVYGRVLPQSSQPAGTYIDTVIATITY
ncbi:spore coat protein U domain-containing protein [Caballeronia sp. AZ10_KS36]|uniref:Csu type fimbrial protein n=1 Tax=Caballeronia sp. AZ10_KS36 TaxID=2921757 RepID=UPI002028B36A|nr:spore coat protein U domain-containing protein [Caballeronia sp. AZ10_KS36]